MEDSHSRSRAIEIHDSNEYGCFQSSRISSHVRYGVGVDGPSVFDSDPFVRRTEALLAVHSRWYKDPFASHAFPSDNPPLFQLGQEAADRNSRSPAVLRLKLVDNIEVLSLLHILRSNFVARITCDLLGHSHFPPLAPPYRNSSNLHHVTPVLSVTCSSAFLHFSLARLASPLPDYHPALHTTGSRSLSNTPH